jgi:hypothetical protein
VKVFPSRLFCSRKSGRFVELTIFKKSKIAEVAVLQQFSEAGKMGGMFKIPPLVRRAYHFWKNDKFFEGFPAGFSPGDIPAGGF